MASHDKLQCPWIHPAIAKLYAERAAYERAGRPRYVVTGADIEVEVARLLELLARERKRG
jgi:hypothetical protein